MKQHIPNILTYARLVLCGLMFVGFAILSLGLTGNGLPLPGGFVAAVTFISFVVAAVTDFFDGWLARRWNVVSTTGAILDPIADKVLVCGALLGLCMLNAGPGVLLASGVILFREFAVSALREVLAPKGIKLPVTFIAKTKTTVQLVAIGMMMAFTFWLLWDARAAPGFLFNLGRASHWVLYLAALITVWTGAEYAFSAARALRTQNPSP